MRTRIILLALLGLAASRGECGSTPQYDACAGKACGEACTACPPDATDCAETAVLKACDPQGRCVPQVEGLCGVAACAGKACGTDCVIDPPCRLAIPPCMMPSEVGHCDGDGACIPGDPPPPGFCLPESPPWSCEGKACGESCGYCPPETDPVNCPVPTFAPTACDAHGECVTAGEFLCTPAAACEGKACGEPCDLCGGACMHPYATACDYAGWCVPMTSWLCQDPCAGKACGEGCTVCPPPPEGEGCVETQELKACDAAGRCASAPAACGP